MIYKRKVQFLQSRWGRWVWSRWRRLRGDEVGTGNKLTELIATYAPDKSWVDIGCMWGINGGHAFFAEESGARPVKGVDVFGPTPEFDEMKAARNSDMEFILGDAMDPATIERVGIVDVVFCAGVLYHHPSPFDLLVSLRRMCRETLILRTSAIPEVGGAPNAAIYWPMLTERDRSLWDLPWLGHQVGISKGFEPNEGYGNWFWGLTPSCLASLLHTAGFRVVRRFPEVFAETLVCETSAVPFFHKVPNERAARDMAKDLLEQRET